MQSPSESEQSEYFDAPLTHFGTRTIESSQDMPSSTQKTYQLRDDGPLYPMPETHVYSTYDSQPTQPALHPRGSEGWLPAVDDPVTDSDTEYETAAGNSVLVVNGNGNGGPGSVKSGKRRSTLVKPPSRKASPVKQSREGSIEERDYAPGAAMGGSPTRRGTTRTSATGTTSPNGHGRSASLARTSSRRSTHTASDGRTIPGSAFVNGAGATGPCATAEEDEELRMRNEQAMKSLTPKQRSKIEKSEAKQGKQLSKIIKNEGKTEKKSLDIAIHELAQLQKFQKQAVKTEAAVQSKHAKLLSGFKKAEAAYLHAKRHYEAAQAQLRAEEEALETLRNSARDATEKMQDKAAEVDSLRTTLAVDEREREVKLGQLKGHSRKSSLW